jgi:hypothetical protein
VPGRARRRAAVQAVASPRYGWAQAAPVRRGLPRARIGGAQALHAVPGERAAARPASLAIRGVWAVPQVGAPADTARASGQATADDRADDPAGQATADDPADDPARPAPPAAPARHPADDPAGPAPAGAPARHAADDPAGPAPVRPTSAAAAAPEARTAPRDQALVGDSPTQARMARRAHAHAHAHARARARMLRPAPPLGVPTAWTARVRRGQARRVGWTGEADWRATTRSVLANPRARHPASGPRSRRRASRSARLPRP